VTTDPNVLARGGPPRPKIRRVYKSVGVEENDGLFRVLLDGKPVMTPQRKALSTKRRALAEAVAAEWEAQTVTIDPEAMPLTRLVSTSLDRVTPQRDAIIDGLIDYAHGDLLCYRAGFPADLKARQEKVWQPVLDWLAATHGVAMTTVAGIMPHSQAEATAEGLRRAIAALDDEHLTAMQAAAAITNSLALSLAMVHRRITAAETFAAANLDESYQIERWGADELAQRRRWHIEADLLAIGEYLRLLKLP
jgi:chaperone required for assembly of F1-ATPase